MNKRMIYRTIATMILLVGCSMGQTAQPGRTSTSGALIYSLPDEGPSFTAAGTTHQLQLASAFGTPVESRKDDGKGPTLAQVRFSARRLAGKQLPPLHYATLARSLGIEPSADEAEMLLVLDKLGVKVYDFDKVDNYLYRQCLRKGIRYRWVWKPVNDKFLDFVRQSHQAWSERPKVGLIADSVYQNVIPIQALETMKNVLANMPDAKFMVSDAAIVDPFLAVTSEHLLAAGKIWIIAQWDEPGFGEEPQDAMPEMQIGPVALPQEISQLINGQQTR